MKILANDGISQSGINDLTDAGFEVLTTTVAQEQLENFINTENIVVLLVRSATTVRQNLIDACPGLRLLEEVVLVWITLMLAMLVKKELM